MIMDCNATKPHDLLSPPDGVGVERRDGYPKLSGFDVVFEAHAWERRPEPRVQLSWAKTITFVS